MKNLKPSDALAYLAARGCALSPATLRRYAQDRWIHSCISEGGHRSYRPADLDAFVRDGTNTGKALVLVVRGFDGQAVTSLLKVSATPLPCDGPFTLRAVATIAERLRAGGITWLIAPTTLALHGLFAGLAQVCHELGIPIILSR
jgi:hypothetical protein